jgi:hypothetical protein
VAATQGESAGTAAPLLLYSSMKAWAAAKLAVSSSAPALYDNL